MAMDKLQLQVLMNFVDRVSAPLARIGKGSKDTAVELKATKDKLTQLEQVQRSIGQFREVRSGLADTETKLQAAQDRVHKLSQSFGKVGPPTKESAAAMASARTEAAQLGAKFKTQQQHAQRLRDTLGAANINTKNLSAHERQLRANIDKTTAQVQKKTASLTRQREINRKMATLQGRSDAIADKREKSRKSLSAGVGVAKLLASPLQKSMDFQDSMADVNNAMDFSDDENGLKKLSDEALNLSKRLPVAAKDIAAIMALGGRSGISPAELISSDGKLGFTEHAVQMGMAFGMTAEQAGKSMAKMKADFGMSIPEVAILTDKIHLLGNTGNADKQKILGILNLVGPAANLASGEIAALGSTLSGMGIAEEVAATGIQNLMQSLVAGEAATQKQQQAFAKLGMNSADVAKKMQADATGTMLAVFEKLRGLGGDEQASVMTQLFGQDSVQAIAPMIAELDALKENFAKVNDETLYGNAVAEKYASIAKYNSHQTQITKNRIDALSIGIGDALMPAFVEVLKIIEPLAEELGALIREYPTLTKWVLLAASGLVALGIAANTCAYGWTFLQGAYNTTKMVLLTLRTAMLLNSGALLAGTNVSKSAIVISKAFAAVTWLVNAALAANPIGLVIVALIALAAAVYMVYTKWDQIKAGAIELWTYLSTLGAKFIKIGSDIIGGIISGIFGQLSALMNAAVGIASSIFTWFQGTLAGKFLQIGIDIVKGLIDGIAGQLTAVKDAILNIAQSISTWFKEALGLNSQNHVSIAHSGLISESAAIGVERGKKITAATVGLAAATTAPITNASHNPPQLVSGNPLAAVHTQASAAQRQPLSTSNSITINAAPSMDPQAIADAVRRELEQRERTARSRIYSQMSDME